MQPAKASCRGRAKLLLLVLVLTTSVPGCFQLGKPPPAAQTLERTEFMMDTIVRITYFQPGQGAAVEKALAAMQEIEEKMSAHLDTSEVSAINRAAGLHPVKVSSQTLQTIMLGLEAGRLTGGAFDITIKPLIDLWGIGKKGDYVPSSEEIESARQLVDYRLVRVDQEAGEVMLEKAGMAMDLGGIAKGYAVDEAARVLMENGVTEALINAGGDIYVLGEKAGGNPWRIAVQHPRRSSDYIAILQLRSISAVTSGDYERFIDVGGQRYHHILDPRTGRPPGELVSATVVASSAAMADALSTAVFVLGLEPGMALLRSLPGVEGLVVTPAGTVIYTDGLKGKVEVLRW
ncbi:MAG: FAD:protein FMN transferase [Bacillota bacterium]